MYEITFTNAENVECSRQVRAASSEDATDTSLDEFPDATITGVVGPWA